MKLLIKIFLLLIYTNQGISQEYYESGNQEYFKGNFEAAISLYSKAIERNENLSKAYMMRGAANTMLGLYPTAMGDLKTSMEVDSNNYKAYFYYGRVYGIQGFNSSAIKYFNIAISKNGTDADIFDDRAIAKAKTGDYGGAIIDENTAIKLNPSNPVYYICRGWAKHQMGQNIEAIADFNKS